MADIVSNESYVEWFERKQKEKAEKVVTQNDEQNAGSKGQAEKKIKRRSKPTGVV